jgi:ubiquinone/menaquinone biosynthesis C-methylase UbiE
MDLASVTPNHHANYPGFAGITGLLAAATMVVGRGSTARWAADLIAIGADVRVVDVGCGPGTAAREAAGRGALVTGVDPAPVMLRVARLLTRSPQITWRRGAAEALPLPDQSADIVWSIASVHHWRDLDPGLRGVVRILVPGGRFLAIEAATRPGATGHATHGWTDEQAEAFLERCRAAGLVDARIVRRERGRHALVAVLAARPSVAA